MRISLATGSGKTRIAAVLLRRMFDAGAFGKALFVCDRTELRDNGLGDFQASFGNNAAEADTRNPQKNARVLIATYQTLDQKVHDTDGKEITFFDKHYPPGFFDVIVIDECHRSAWGDWFAFLKANFDGIHIGLTATPREIKLPQTDDELTKQDIDNDRQRRLPTFSFKCMASNDGQSLIADFRDRQRAYFIATTMDLLTTGVNVPCVRNIVFFRYIRSPILFHQIVGRGTRVDGVNDKLMFGILDYTGATALFGADFITPPPGDQNKIAARLDAELVAARALFESLQTRLAEIELLPATLLRSVFNGN